MAIDFPTATTVGQVYTDPTSGNSYVVTVVGPPAQWVGSGSSTDLSATFLRKDASNDPVTGTLTVTPATNVEGLVVTQPSGNTAAALRITNEGTGNSLVVEDSANPDSSPTVIDSSGRLLVGMSTALNVGGNAGFEPLQVNGIGISLPRFAAAGNGSILTFSRSLSATTGTNTVVTSGTSLGGIEFTAADGTSYPIAAQIISAVDGTPGLNDMPGRLVFSTTANGAATPTEAMRITSGGTTLLAGPNINLSGFLLTGDNTWRVVTAWSTVSTANGGGNFLVLVSNNTTATAGKHGLYRVLITQDGTTIGGVVAVSVDANFSANFRVNAGNLEALAFDTGVGLSTNCRLAFIINDLRVHIY